MSAQFFLWTLVIALFLVGLAGTILPALPGNLLIFAGALVYGLFSGFEEVTIPVLAVLAGISVAAQVLDYAAEAYGAHRFGATKYGMWGAIIGGIIGFMALNIGGLIVGIFLGAIIPEMTLAGRSLKGALRIGWGSLLGFLGGTLMKFILGLVTIGIFLAALASCSVGRPCTNPHINPHVSRAPRGLVMSLSNPSSLGKAPKANPMSWVK